MTKILAIPGSLRERSSNLSLLRAAAEEAPTDVEVVLWRDLAELPHFNPDLDVEPGPPAVERFRALLRESQGLVISSPEYAHGIPGSLKNALDWVVSSGELYGKPAVLLNAATSGGEHAQAALVEVLSTQGARVLVKESLMGPILRHKIDPAGRVIDPELRRALRVALEALLT